MDIIEGKGSSAFNRTAEFGASFGMGKAIYEYSSGSTMYTKPK